MQCTNQPEIKMLKRRKSMNRELAIEYEVFEEEGEVVLSVVDKEKDEVLNMFKGKMEKVYQHLKS